jgi:hypothetical protein
VSTENVQPQVIVIERRGNGMATAGFVCSLVGAVLGLIPLLFFFAWILGPLGLVFGAIGWKNARAGRGGKGLAIAGVILGIAAIGLGIIGYTILSNL